MSAEYKGRTRAVVEMGLSCRIESVSLNGHEAAVRFYPAARAAAPTIIALHGFTGSGEDFMPLREAMGQGAWNWICPDFFGHGLSGSPEDRIPYSLESALQLIEGARALVPQDSTPHLLAYSMGGRIALHYLMQSRPLPCALIGASPGIADPAERADRAARDQALVEMLLSGGVDAFCRHWESQPLIEPQTRLPEPLRTELMERRRANTVAGLVNTLKCLGTGILPSLWAALGSLQGVSCLFGEKDGKFGEIAAKMATVNKRITLHPVPESGHAPHLEKPHLLAALVEGAFSH